MSTTYLGQPCLFSVLEDDPRSAELSDRERRILVGAVNAHVLTTPDRELTIHVYEPNGDYTPRTSDDRTFDGCSRLYRRRRFTIVVRSRRQASPVPLVGRRTAMLLASTTRHVQVSDDATAHARQEYQPPRGLRAKTLRRFRNAAPLLYDETRDLELLRFGLQLRRPLPRRDAEEEMAVGGALAGHQWVPAGPVATGAPRAVLIGMHWFELGGAERWAFETVRLAREAGFVPIVVSTRDSHHEWITRPELDGAILVPLSEPTSLSQTPGGEQLLRTVLETFDVRGVVVHHSQWLYDRLPFVKKSRPDVPIVDSTHIVEYRGGGFPATSVRHARYLDTHHVISPSLERWMVQTQRVRADQVVMAPLGGLTVDAAKAAVFRPRRDTSRPFTVAFIGRLHRQKGAEVFIETAARARRQGLDARFILQGHGELRSWVDDLVADAGIGDVLERRDGDHPVAETLAESDLLAVTSHNEGLTLTTLEAIACGVPVVSTDVGAQSDLVPREALVPRNVHRAVRAMAELFALYAADEDARERLWRTEREAEHELLAHRTANAWFTEVLTTW